MFEIEFPIIVERKWPIPNGFAIFGEDRSSKEMTTPVNAAAKRVDN